MIMKLVSGLKAIKKSVLVSAGLLGLLVTGICLAAPANVSSFSGMATNMQNITKSVVTIISDISIMASIFFLIHGLMKWRMHSQNPQQVPLSHGLTSLLIGLCLGVTPALIKVGQNSLLGGAAKNKSTISGGSMTGIFKSS